MKPKVIISDIDGTLLSKDSIVLESTLEAIKLCKEQGMLFGLATGRDIGSVKDLISKWGVKEYVDFIVGSGGSETYDVHTNEYHMYFPLEGKLILEVIEHFKDLDVNFTVPHEGRLFVPKDDIHIKNLSAVDEIPYDVVNFEEFCQEPRLKVMIVCDPSTMPLVVERSKSFSSTKYASHSLITASILYEYMDPRVHKAFGLEKVLAPYNITLEDMLAFGDADNDTKMLELVGIGVCMGNGSEASKASANYITDTNQDHGIANFIHNYIL